jgi:hypothetical protein
MPGFMQFLAGTYLFVGLTWFGSFSEPPLYMAALAFTAYGVHWWAIGLSRAFGGDARPNAMMSVAFTALSVLGLLVFFHNSADTPVAWLFVGLTVIYICDFFASLGVALGTRALGLFHLATGFYLLYLTFAAALNFAAGLLLPRCQSSCLMKERPGRRSGRSGSLVIDDEDGHSACVHEMLGDAGEQQTPSASVVVVTAHDQINAVGVHVVKQGRGRVAVNDLMGDVDAGAGGSISDVGESGFQVAVCSIGGLAPIRRGFGVGGGVGDRDRHELGVVATRDVDRDVKRAHGEPRAVPGEQDSLEHQRRMGTRDRATMSATSMYNRYRESCPD